MEGSLVFFGLPDEEKRAIFEKISEESGIPPYAVEKDWWVTQVLAVIFDMEIGAHLVFKGGTSLSKAWRLIERFSEDIDLAVDRRFLGFDGELSKNQRSNLRKAAKRYITEGLHPALTKEFENRGFSGLRLQVEETKASDQDPNLIDVYYPYVIDSPGYIQPRVQLEIGCRSLMEPHDLRVVQSLVGEHFVGAKFAGKGVAVPAVRPERTFLEKVFLLHEEFQRPAGKMRVDRLSRHLYDVFQLSGTSFGEAALKDSELYETIVRHRYQFTRIGGVDYNLHQPQTINPIPVAEVISQWKADYLTMQEQMIYGESPSFEELLNSVRETTSRFNSQEWKMEIVFGKR